MDLALINEDCKNKFLAKWIDVGASKLCLNFALFSCEELHFSKKVSTTISTDDLAYLVSTKVLVGWQGLKDVNGNEVPYTPLNAFNALANDLDFLNLVSSISFERSNFI